MAAGSPHQVNSPDRTRGQLCGENSLSVWGKEAVHDDQAH